VTDDGCVERKMVFADGQEDQDQDRDLVVVVTEHGYNMWALAVALVDVYWIYYRPLFQVVVVTWDDESAVAVAADPYQYCFQDVEHWEDYPWK